MLFHEPQGGENKMRVAIQEFSAPIPKHRFFSLELPKKAEILVVQEQQGELNISVLAPIDAYALTETRNFILTSLNEFEFVFCLKVILRPASLY